MKLLIATTNAGKLREFIDLLGGESIQIISLSALPALEAPEETGKTFRANAILKAIYYARKTRQWTLADDSGLAVDALDGAPGVFSARWAEMHDAGTGDADNNRLLLKQLGKAKDKNRTARFVCALALSNPRGQVIATTRGTVEGEILRRPRGQNGFGYDPLFFIPGKKQTSAQLSPAEKHAISHRGQALRRMRRRLMDVDLKT